MNLPDTSTKASLGHGKNQSIEHCEKREGNIVARVRNLVPMGVKANTMWRQSFTRLRKAAAS